MRRLSARSVLLAPAVILTVGACFATRSDFAVLQGDLQVVRGEVQSTRAQMLTADSALHRQLDEALASVASTLGMIADTLQSVHATTLRLRGDLREDLQAVRQQLIMIQERAGESQRRIAELRADLEADTRERATPVTVPARDSTKPPTADSGRPPAPAPPGPAQLLQMAQDQLRRGSNSSARGAFGALLTQFPTSDLAPEALYGVAESFASEGNGVAADSVYSLVVQRYPTSERAPTALYKRATALRVVGRTAEARVLYQQIVDRYPRSEAALLADGFLGTRRP